MPRLFQVEVISKAARADAANDETISAAMSALRGVSPDCQAQALPISQAPAPRPPSSEDLAEVDARMELAR